MRVALISGTYGPGQGTGGQCWMLAQGLLARGHQVEVWARRSALEVRPLPKGRRALLRFMERFPRARFDLVHGLERVPGCDVYRAGGGVHESWLASAGAGRGWWPRERLESRLDRLAAQSAGHVICNAKRTAAEVVAYHHVPTRRVRVVRNGVDLERFAPRGAPVGGRRTLFLGHGFRRKGLWTAAQSFAQASEGRGSLWVVGQGEGRVRRQVQRLLGERVVWLGAVRDPERLIPTAAAVILPTWYDASANTTLEAMACGVPAITSGRDGAGEVVPDPRLVVSHPGDVTGWAEALRYAWAGGPALRRRCRQAACEWPASRMVSGTLRLYRERLDG